MHKKNIFRHMIIIIIIILKSSTGPCEKNKIVHKLLTQFNWKLKNKLKEATNDWQLP